MIVPGTKLGRYEIRAKIGAGGMGEVYLAQDTKLDRNVALKILPAEMAANQIRMRRFVQEAKAASGLNHPNIITIHEIDQSGSDHFIATEFIDGETLRDRLVRAPMKLAEVLDLATQIASALSAAHAAGIIHRDIKPENIMLRRDGIVKVLDFGLAKLTEQEALEPVDQEAPTRALMNTDPGAVMGTVVYMSPEQARGMKVDARTDIFSFGALIYEMVTGRLPFEGSSTNEILASILNDKEPLPLARFAHGVPPELERMVSKTLRKNRDERYQTSKDLLIDLRRLKEHIEFETRLEHSAAPEMLGKPTSPAEERSTQEHSPGVRSLVSWRRGSLLMVAVLVAIGMSALIYFWRMKQTSSPSQPEIKSLAVMPLKSLDSSENYLGLGIADAVIRRISQSGELIVRPTSAVRRYLNQETDALAAARELRVDSVLEGTVQRANDRLRVSVNLLRTSDGTSLWADQFDLHMADIFTIQDAVSQQVASRLRVRLDPAQQARLTKRYTSNPDAYNYYAKAMYHFTNIGPDLKSRPESDLAVDLFKKAIELDPSYALAHAQLGYTYARIAVFQEDNPPRIEESKQELGIAERLDPQLAEVHVARYFIAFSQYQDWQVETAVRELRLAQQLDPNAGHTELGDLYAHIGLEKQAIEELESALKLDPNNEQIKNQYVYEYFASARADKGLAANQRFFNRGPDLRYYLEKRMAKEAAPLVEEAYQEKPDDAWRRKDRALLLALQGKHQEAEAAAPAIMKDVRRNRGYHHITYDIARIYALGGKSEESLKWLRLTVTEGFPCYPLFERDSFLDRIRKDPAFLQFMAEMKARWENYQREFG